MVDVSSIAPDAQEEDELDDSHLYRILIYGNPGTGKTHYAYTMPEPVVMIDTEGKADVIIEKFDKEIIYFDVDDYPQAREALSQGLDVLSAYKRQEGMTGTIVIDSMSEIWDWCQQHHIKRKYPQADGKDDVNLQSGLQSGGGSDWQKIKRYHNNRFRKPIVTSDYHVCWTAKSEEDFTAILEGSDDPPAKPSGEKNNIYRATELLHVYQGQDGIPHANLKKTALTRFNFGQMEWPTFGKTQEVIETVANAEKDPQNYTVGQIKNKFTPDVSIHEGDPDVVMQNGE